MGYARLRIPALLPPIWRSIAALSAAARRAATSAGRQGGLGAPRQFADVAASAWQARAGIVRSGHDRESNDGRAIGNFPARTGRYSHAAGTGGDHGSIPEHRRASGLVERVA